jgi:biopolymer transport protein ExbD
MHIKRRLPQDPQGHSSALNDILFILLLFFLIISTLANPNVVKLSIPKAKSDTKAKQTVVVSINDKQEFFVGTTSVAVD